MSFLGGLDLSQKEYRFSYQSFLSMPLSCVISQDRFTVEV
jgi:hypothetical protein